MPENGQPDAGDGGTTPEEASIPRDWRAVIVACSGLLVVAVTAIVGFVLIPGTVAEDEVSTKGENIVAISAAAFTAVASALSAYFGIKAANLAREEAVTAAERSEIRTAELAGAEPDEAGDANVRATQQIKELGLEARPSGRRGGGRAQRR